MKHRRVWMPLLALISSLVWGQENPQQKIRHAFQLAKQGQFAQVIKQLKPLTQVASITTPEFGQTWILLGIAYHQEGRYQEAETAYEQSLNVLRKTPEYSEQYATALSAYSTLYRDKGNMEAAWKMRMEALRVYEEINEQAGIADACASLAELAIAQKHASTARAYLNCAIEASKVASGLTEDFFASLSSTQGWLNETDKNYAAAESEYEHALMLWKHQHGEQHFLVGWGYMLLGKANAGAGDMTNALDNMRKGLGILGNTAGTANIKYLVAELAYSEALNASGAHTSARQLKTKTESALQNFFRDRCIRCRTSAAALSLQ
jgi:tetratricopeptide (TPR) repeat protein